VFAYHDCRRVIRRPTFRRASHEERRVRGHEQEGTTTAPIDMETLDEFARLRQVRDAVDRIPGPGAGATCIEQAMPERRFGRHPHIVRHDEDPPAIRNGASRPEFAPP
jgi:phosphoketolase